MMSFYLINDITSLIIDTTSIIIDTTTLFHSAHRTKVSGDKPGRRFRHLLLAAQRQRNGGNKLCGDRF